MLKELSVSRHYAPVRVCADMCFYFYVVSLFSFTVLYTASSEKGVYGVVSNLIAPWSTQLAVLVGACFALGFLIVRVDNAVIRFILSLLPGLSFLMSPFQPVLLIHAAAWAYYILMMTIGNFEVYLDVYRKRSRVMLFITLILTGCLIIFHFGTDDWYGKTLFGGELFGLLYFVMAVMSLRGMRLSLGAPAGLRVADSAYIVILPALLIAAFFLLKGMVPAVTSLIKLLARFLGWLFKLLFPGRDLPEIFHPPEEDMDNGTIDDPISLPPDGKDQTPTPEMISGKDPHFTLSGNTIFVIMIALLAAVLVFIAIRQLRGRQKDHDKPRRVRERIEKMPFEGIRLRRSGDTALTANVRQIRRTYRSYLEHLASNRTTIAPSETSQDVLDDSSAYIGIPENRTLRELYIAARYGDPDSVTSGQAAEAKRCLNAIKSVKISAADQQ